MTPIAALPLVIDALVPAELHQAAWAACSAKRWYFGNQSDVQSAGVPFWKMDLDGEAVFDRIWAGEQARCEAAAGRRLRVVRQYANGHTFGLGGQPHVDDAREGCHTLLYYPMLVWPREWEGETVFHQANGEIALAVLPAPNRAVLFDSRIAHAGRAPSRRCGTLRVTVAFKLEPA